MDPKRRKYLKLLLLGATGTLAGCTGDGDDNGLGPVEDTDDQEEETNEDDENGDSGDEDNDLADEEEDDEDDDELRQMDLSFGDTVEHPDGFHITPFEPDIVDTYETERLGDIEVVEPENEQFVFIEIEIENVSNSTVDTPNPLSFEMIVAGQQFERISLVGQQPVDHNGYPGLQTLAPGSTGSGDVIYDTLSGDVELFYSGRTEDFDTVEAIWS